MGRRRVVTNSEMRAFRGCARYHGLAYLDGYRPRVEPSALSFGTLIHLGLETWWTGRMQGVSPDPLLTATLDAVACNDDLYVAARARAMLAGYHARWLSDELEPIAVEAEFRCPLLDPRSGRPYIQRLLQHGRTAYILAGKIDVIVRDRLGRIWLVEHKSSSEDITPGSVYWARLRLDTQIGTYFMGARSLGHDVHGCLYDVLAKPNLRPLRATSEASRKYRADGLLYASQREKDETPAEYEARLLGAILAQPWAFYQRAEVARLERDLARHAEDIWQTVQAMQRAERLGERPRNPDHCFKFGRPCSFFPVCTDETSLEGGDFVRIDTLHPELTKETNGTDDPA